DRLDAAFLLVFCPLRADDLDDRRRPRRDSPRRRLAGAGSAHAGALGHGLGHAVIERAEVPEAAGVRGISLGARSAATGHSPMQAAAGLGLFFLAAKLVT